MAPDLEGLVQPDRRSCGAACLVAARMLSDPAYAARVGHDDFRAEVLATHRRVTGLLGATGRWQLPWPRAIGTPPWAVARELGGRRVSWVRLGPGAGFDRVLAAVRVGRVVPVYAGSRWLPRHVVLALGETAAGDGLRCYEPSGGHVVDVERADFAGHRLRLAGWDHAWCVVPPATPR